MEKVFTENRKLLTRYLGAVGCEKIAALLMVTELRGEEAVEEMLEFCASNPSATQQQLLKASSEISSRYRRNE